MARLPEKVFWVEYLGLKIMRIILLRSTGVMPDPPVEKMANTLSDLGYEVKILAWDREAVYRERTSRKQLLDVEVDIIHFGIPAKYSGGLKNLKALALFEMRVLLWLLRHHKEYDAVHAFDFDTGFAALLGCRIYGKKLIYHVLDYYIEGHILGCKILNPIIEFFEIHVINTADATVICTEKRKEQINKAKPKKLYVIHNTPEAMTVPNNSFRLMGEHSKAKIAYVGVLTRMRLLKETVNTVAGMENVEMHIGGFGEYEDWMREAAEKYDNIFFYGKLQYADTLSLENQCDIMIAAYDPSIRNHKYSAPNKFYESLMLGKPIIMAQDTGYDDVISENDIGVLAEYSQEGIRKAIETLKARCAEWPEMGQRAKQLYRDAYSWEIMKQRIQEMYHGIES